MYRRSRLIPWGGEIANTSFIIHPYKNNFFVFTTISHTHTLIKSVRSVVMDSFFVSE